MPEDCKTKTKPIEHSKTIALYSGFVLIFSVLSVKEIPYFLEKTSYENAKNLKQNEAQSAYAELTHKGVS